jgi:hypothetical protein
MHSSSRESSMTAQHAQGPGIPASGLQSFPANVVPAGAQGQPYRGQGGQAESDRGRTTPSSGPSEMTEEDIAHYQQLKSDHKELSKSIEVGFCSATRLISL